MPNSHKFFAIKTIDDADYVVQAIKDMFQVSGFVFHSCEGCWLSAI